MPSRLALSIIPCHIPSSLPHLGEAVRAVVYDSMLEASPAFAARIHGDDDYKPFVVSAPIRPRRPRPPREREGAAAEPEAWTIYCSCLDEELTDALVQGLWVRYRANQELRLGPAVFRFADPPWRVLAAMSYEQLLEARPRTSWLFRFVSPMALTSRNQHLPLPVPDLVFRSLVNKWNTVAPSTLHLDPETGEQIPAAVGLSSSRGETRSVRLTNHTEVGFVGEAAFRPVTHDQRLDGLIAALAQFAGFAGVGRKTTIGMGQVLVQGG